MSVNQPEILAAGYADKAVLESYYQRLIHAVLINSVGRFRVEHFVREAFYARREKLEEFFPKELKRAVNLEVRAYTVRRLPVSVGKKTILELLR